MHCVACLQGFTWECQSQGKCDDGNSDSSPDRGNLLLAGGIVDAPAVPESIEADQIRTYKDDSALRDQQSTGRKRAAKLFPLNEDAECEWRMKKNCGGGDHPITGCLAGMQQARHHGPIKNTLNNDKDNVHLICHTCHNRWHTLNDPGYVWDKPYPAHAPIEANIVEMAESETFWHGKSLVKAKD